MLRSAIIAVCAITLGTMLGSGSANATVTVLGDMIYDIVSMDCLAPECVATLNPVNPELYVSVSGGDGLPNVDVTDVLNFSLNVDNDSNSNQDVFVRVFYDFGIEFTNPLRDFGSYQYVDGVDTSGSCSYPPGGQFSSPGVTCAFGVSDYNEGDFGVQAHTDMTFDITATINAQAGSLPEPSSVGMLASALVIFGWLYRRRQSERRQPRPATVAQSR